MTRILIRCDASLSIGSGHVMRCRTLAREMIRRGAEPMFLCRRQSGDLISLLEQEFSVLVLPEQQLATTLNTQGTNLHGRELYDAWLGCSQQQDIDQTLVILNQVGISSLDWIVVDHYGLDSTWQKQVIDECSISSGSRPKCLVIDDLADRPHQADLLLDQNFFGGFENQRYQGLVSKQCSQLLGPNYALLGPEYAQLHPIVTTRTQLRRVFVFFGGVDPGNLTVQALEALMKPELSHLDVDVVLGIRSPHRSSVEALVSQRANTTLHGLLPSLAGLMAKADLAIGAGGATTWERACLGLPSLVVPFADNQLESAEALARNNHIVLLKQDSFDLISIIHSSLVNIAHSFASMTHELETRITDGKGVHRVINSMSMKSIFN